MPNPVSDEPLPGNRAETASIGQRRLGMMKGRIWIAPDFDATPSDLIELMEGGETDSACQ